MCLREIGHLHMVQLPPIVHDRPVKTLSIECDCVFDCPSCVGLPNLRLAIHSDLDLMRGLSAA